MTEIVKCADFGCPSRGHYWRFMAPASAEQTFADFGSERGTFTKKCDHYVNGDLARRQWRASQENGRSKTANSSRASVEKV